MHDKNGRQRLPPQKREIAIAIGKEITDNLSLADSLMAGINTRLIRANLQDAQPLLSNRMALETTCPGTVHLHRYLLGQASATEAASVAEHLKHCSRCLAIVAELKVDDCARTSLGDEPGQPLSMVSVTQPAAAPEESQGTTLLSSCDDADDSSDPTLQVSVPADDDDQTSLLDDSSQDDDRTSVADPSHSDECRTEASSRETCAYQGAGDVPPTVLAGPVPPSRPALAGGVIVPGYEILQELGRGGMGVVYKARHLRLQRLVALKMILAGSHAGRSRLARFRAEAAAVTQLQHPNLVQIYETGEHQGQPYISLEFVEGGNLEQRMRESPTTPRAAAELVAMLAHTMDVAHQRGIVHRDLKPANILLAELSSHSSVLRKVQTVSDSLAGTHWTRTTFPKIADFGLAKRVDEDSTQTQSGAILGTPCYMAPEQAAGKTHEIGPAADIYALGAILYDLLVGRPPFRAGNPIDTIRQVVEQDPIPPRQLEPRVPHDLETICLKCLEKEPARRYASAGELAADLRHFLYDEPIHARPTPAWELALKWSKRRPTLVALLGVSAAAILGMVLFMVWHNVSLRGERDQARAEERLARLREQDALESQRLTRVQTEGQRLLDAGRLAVAARDWPGPPRSHQGADDDRSRSGIRGLEGAGPRSAQTGRRGAAHRRRTPRVSDSLAEIRRSAGRGAIPGHPVHRHGLRRESQRHSCDGPASAGRLRHLRRRGRPARV